LNTVLNNLKKMKSKLSLSTGSNLTEFYIMNPNSTEPVVINGSEEHREVWRARMRAVRIFIMVITLGNKKPTIYIN